MKSFLVNVVLFILFLGLVYAALYLTGNSKAFLRILSEVWKMFLSAFQSVKAVFMSVA